MDIPHQELLAPLPPVDSVAGIDPRAEVVSVFGRAKDLARLERLERLSSLWISGVDARAAVVVSCLARLERLVIHDLRVADLGFVAPLRELRHLSIAGSSRLKSTAGIEGLAHLRELVLFDNCNYTTIEPLARLTDLEMVCLEGGFSKRLRIDTLRPLGGLRKLRRLRLASLRVGDASLRPLHGLAELREVFIANVFTPAEFHALAAALPEVRGEYVDSFRGAR